MERQIRSVQARVSAGLVRTVFIQHARARQLIVEKTQQLASTEHAHVTFQLDARHRRIIAGNGGNQRFGKQTSLIIGIRPQCHSLTDNIHNAFDGICRQCLQPITTYRPAQITDYLRSEHRIS